MSIQGIYMHAQTYSHTTTLEQSFHCGTSKGFNLILVLNLDFIM